MTARRVPTLGIALLVGIAAGVAPIAYAALVVNVPSGPPTPVVTFGNATSERGGTQVLITGADPARPVWEFGARLTRDGVVTDELSRIDQPTSWTFSFFDQDDDRRLSVGDGFFLQFRMLGHMELRLLWQGSSIAVAAWDVVVPAVTFADPQIGSSWVTLDVATAVPPAALGDFSATLSRDWSTISWISPLMAYNDSSFAFADRDGDGRLSAGDRFSQFYSGAGDYELRLDWLGNNAATADWSTAHPNLAFSVTAWNATTTWLNVTFASSPRPCADYSGVLYLNTSWRDQIVGLCGGASSNGMMRAYDLDADSRLSVGDRITVTVDSPGLWRLSLYWQSIFVTDVSWVI